MLHYIHQVRISERWQRKAQVISEGDEKCLEICFEEEPAFSNTDTTTFKIALWGVRPVEEVMYGVKDRERHL